MSSPTPASANAGASAVARGAPAILHVDAAVVELGWRDKSGPRYSSCDIESPGNAGIVSAAKQLVAEAGKGCRRVTLALAASMFDSRQMLIGRLPDGQAQDVLARKAANGIGTDIDDCLYWAQRCHPPLAESDSTQETWLVHSHPRSRYVDLLLRLRRAGIQVVRAVATSEVLSHLLDGVDGDGGRILVSTTGRAVYAHLFRGHHLVQESRLPLNDFSLRSGTYETVVQDVRQLAAFWAKGSRGAPLEGVYVHGFSAEECESLKTTLGIAAQGAEVTVLSQPILDDYESLRSLLLRILQANASRGHALYVPLAPRPSRIAAAAAALSVVAAFGASKLLGFWSDHIGTRNQQIAALLEGTSGVEDGEVARAEYLAARQSLQTTIGNLNALAREGLPLESALDHVFDRFARFVDIDHVTFERAEGGTRIFLEASLPHDVEVAAHQLELLRRLTERDKRFVEVSFEPSSRVPDVARDEVLSFTFIGLYAESGA